MIANIVDWMKCFTTYVTAMATKFPESVTEMLAYHLVIIKASQQCDGLYWRVYDIHFRVNAAASGNRKWSQVDTDLYTRFFTGRAREVRTTLSTLRRHQPYRCTVPTKHGATLSHIASS